MFYDRKFKKRVRFRAYYYKSKKIFFLRIQDICHINNSVCVVYSFEIHL